MKDIECEICCTCFDDCNRRPRFLLCGHTFCTLCLKRLLKYNCINCPNCQQRHIVDDVDKLLVNYAVENLLSSSDKGSNTKTNSNKCAEHGYELNFFCKKHDTWICRDCTVIDHKARSKTENCCVKTLECSTECLDKEDCHVVSKKEYLETYKYQVINNINAKFEKRKTKLNEQYLECLQDKESKLKLHVDIRVKLIQFTEENHKAIEILKEEQELVKLIPLGIENNETLLEGIKKKINASTSSQEIENSMSIAKELKIIDKRFVEQKCQIKQSNSNANNVEIKWKELDMYKSEIIDLNNQLEEKDDTIETLLSKLAKMDKFYEAVIKIMLKHNETENDTSIFAKFRFKNSLKYPTICIKKLESILEKKDKISEDHKETSNNYKSKYEELEALYIKSKSKNKKLKSHVEELEKELNSELEREFHSMEDLCEEGFEEEECNEDSQTYIDGLIELLQQVSSVTPQNVSAIKEFLKHFEDEVYITADKCFDCRTEHRRYGKLTIENGRLVLNQMTEEIPTAKSIILQVCETGARLVDGWVEQMRGDEMLVYIYRDRPLIRQRERPPALYVCPMKQLLASCKDIFFSLKVVKQDVDNKEMIYYLKDPLTVLHIRLHEEYERPEIQIRREALIRSCSSYAGESWEKIPFDSLTFPYEAKKDGEMFNCIFYKELNNFGKPVMYNLKYGDRNFKPFDILEGYVYAYHVGGFSICFSADLTRNTNQVELGCIESEYKIIQDAAYKYGYKNIQFGKTYVSLEDLF